METRLRPIGPVVIGALTALLYLLTAHDSYGLFRDELYYLANGEHLGLGYVEHPPLIGWIAWFSRNAFGESLTGLRLLPALAGGITVTLVGLIAREFGGGRFAQAFAAILAAVAPSYVASFGYLSMNAFDVMFWSAAMLILARLLRTRDFSLWLPFGVVTGIGLQNKISPIFLGFGLVVGLLVTRDWEPFRDRRLWIGGAVAAAIFLPHLIWQAVHGWPMLAFIENATRYKNLPLSPIEFLSAQGLMMGPLGAAVAVAGLYFLLISEDGRSFRAVGWCFVAILVLMIFQRAKPYYFSPAYPVAFAAGALVIERVTARFGRTWSRAAIVALVALSGLGLVPMAKPVLPVERFVAYQAALGMEPGTSERKEVGRLPQFFADRLGWRELAETVARVHAALPVEDQARACVFGQNYGQAGAIEFYGRELGLPKAISGHNSYHLWGAGDCSGEVMLVMGDDAERLNELFESVELGATFHCDDCMPYENDKPIWVCRNMRLPFEQLWPQIGHYD
jgi:hypothetical protein